MKQPFLFYAVIVADIPCWRSITYAGIANAIVL